MTMLGNPYPDVFDMLVCEEFGLDGTSLGNMIFNKNCFYDDVHIVKE